MPIDSKKMISIVVVLLLAAGCQTPTPYQSRNKPSNDFGYKDKKLDDGFYKVSFKGNEYTPKSEVERKMLYRAAEVTEKNGFKYFTFDDLEVKKTVEVEPYYYRNTFDLTPTFANTMTPYRVTYYTNGYAWAAADTGRNIDVDDRYKVVGFIRMYNSKPKTLNSIEAAQIKDKIESISEIK